MEKDQKRRLTAEKLLKHPFFTASNSDQTRINNNNMNKTIQKRIKLINMDSNQSNKHYPWLYQRLPHLIKPEQNNLRTVIDALINFHSHKTILQQENV